MRVGYYIINYLSEKRGGYPFGYSRVYIAGCTFVVYITAGSGVRGPGSGVRGPGSGVRGLIQLWCALQSVGYSLVVVMVVVVVMVMIVHYPLSTIHYQPSISNHHWPTYNSRRTTYSLNKHLSIGDIFVSIFKIRDNLLKLFIIQGKCITCITTVPPIKTLYKQ